MMSTKDGLIQVSGSTGLPFCNENTLRPACMEVHAEHKKDIAMFGTSSMGRQNRLVAIYSMDSVLETLWWIKQELTVINLKRCLWSMCHNKSYIMSHFETNPDKKSSSTQREHRQDFIHACTVYLLYLITAS